MRLVKAWLFAGWLALCLAGCVQGPGGVQTPHGLGRADRLTESDESSERRRARMRLELASAYFQQGQTLVALDEVKQSISIDPQFVEAYNLRGLVYMRLNEWPLSVESFQRALALNPADADVAHNYAWLLCQQSRHAEATVFFSQALANPAYAQSGKTWRAQGLCQMQSGQTGAAEASLTRSYQLDPNHPLTTFHLAKLLYERGDFETAQSHLHRLNASASANAESLWLEIKTARQLKNPLAETRLAALLRDRFAQSRELIAYEKGAFHD